MAEIRINENGQTYCTNCLKKIIIPGCDNASSYMRNNHWSYCPLCGDKITIFTLKPSEEFISIHSGRWNARWRADYLKDKYGR